MKMLKSQNREGGGELYAFMHCSGDISSAFLNSRLIALGTLFISGYIPSLKIHTNCSRKSNCHKFQLFSADGFWKSAAVTEDFVPEGQL